MEDKIINLNLVLNENQKKDEAQREKENRVLKQVFGYHLAKEFKDKKIKASKMEDFVKERLLVYFDALERGCPVVQNRLETDGFTLESQSAKKTYSVKDGKLQWQIGPKSTDLFEALNFHKTHDSGETTGVTDIWLEPVLVEQVLLEGFRQQELLYLSFDHARRKILEVETTAQVTLQYLNRRELDDIYFRDIVEAYGTIDKVRASENVSLKDAFIKTYIASEANNVTQKTAETLEICDQILILDEFFLKGDGQSISEGRRTKQLNSLVVELVCNPESFQTPSDLTNHRTTKDSLHSRDELLKNTAANADDQELKVLVAHLAQSILEEEGLKGRLKTIFAEIGVSEDLGQKFLYNLIYLKLTKLPEIDQPAFYYYLKAEPRPKRIQETKLKSWGEDKIDMIKDFFDRNYYLPRQKFRSIGQELQKELLKGIIEKAKTINNVSQKGTIKGILTGADLIYQTSTEGKALLKASAKKSSLAQIAARSTLEILIDEIKNGNGSAVETLDGFLAQGIVHESAGEHTFVEKVTKHGFYSKAGHFLEEYRDQENLKETEDKLVDFVCLTALDRSFIRGQPNLNNQLLELKHMVISQVSEFIKSTKIGIQMEEMTAEQLAKLIYFHTDLKERDFLTRAREIQAEKRKLYISEGQDLAEAIIGVLENSLEEMSKPNPSST